MRKVVIAQVDEWWDGKTKEFKKEYIERHPHSKYARSQISDKKKETSIKPGTEKNTESFDDWANSFEVKNTLLGMGGSQPLDKEMLRFLKRLNADLPRKKVEAALQAHASYSRGAYGGINRKLREGQIPKNIPDLDNYMLYADKYTGDILYRGVGADYANSLEPGKTYKDLAYMSCTSDYQTALNFSKRKKVGCVMEIHGVKGKASAGSSQELEHVLPRGSSFKVVDYDAKKRRLIAKLVNS
jgi:hypothetical protein